jgi:microcystin degradation protein MlrC
VQLAIGAISHETNTFSKTPTTIDSFERYHYAEGHDIIEVFRDTGTPIAGFIDAAQQRGFTLIPTIAAYAPPSGIVTASALRTLIDRLCERLTVLGEQIDGLLLDLHGAMVSEISPGGDADVLWRVREIVGQDLPVGIVLDSHGNLCQELVNLPSVLVGLDTYPHVDMRQRGQEAAQLLLSVIDGSVKPVKALRKLPILAPLPGQRTERPVMRELLSISKEIEANPRVLNATVTTGFPFADVPHAGFSAVVTTNGDQLLADQLADQIVATAWSRRQEFVVDTVNVEEAVHQAMASRHGPVIIADLGDDPGAGAPGDGTALLWALLDLGARDAVFAVIADPEAVDRCATAGVGEQIRLDLGGKTDRRHGYPVEVQGEVKRVTDGRFRRSGPVAAGIEVSLGRTAVISAAGRHEGRVEIIVSERRTQVDDLTLFRILGMDPATKKMVAVKSNVSFRPAFTPTASDIIETATPGITTPDFDFFEFRQVHRPIFPIDSI